MISSKPTALGLDGTRGRLRRDQDSSDGAKASKYLVLRQKKAVCFPEGL